jgi:DNA mismatch repair protein MutL
MGNIRVMSELLANKIAAGEVVERPASVVKELLENAVDAGANRIAVEVEQGGLTLIRVTDNGCGMDREDAVLAFERHATSKIREDKDLFRIRTLGFRGEALPSIAAVSRVEVRTRPQEQADGTRLRIHGGNIVEQEVTGAPVGTEITVRDLFYNTPARLKYLKSIQTELGHVIDAVQRMALAHPEISFQFRHNGHSLLQTPGDGKLLHVVAAIYGREIAKQMMMIEWEDADYRIAGFSSFPEVTRSNRNHCLFFVNGRSIRSYQLLRAVQDAYHTRLPINRYPICVLHLGMDPTLVDVNVHPAKLEVRFSEEQDVAARVQEAIRQALVKGTFIPKVAVRTREKERGTQVEWALAERGGSAQPPVTPRTSYTRGNTAAMREPISNERIREAALEAYRPLEGRKDGGGDTAGHVSEEKKGAPEGPFARQEDPSIRKEGSSARPDGTLLQEEDRPAERNSSTGTELPEEADRGENPRFPRLRAVAQALGMYVIAQNENGLYIIDQHAAHEKILFEKFSRRMAERKIQPLSLLVPLTLEVTPGEAEILANRLPYLKACQIDVERFGGTTFLVRTVPDLWEGLDAGRLTRELIDDLLQGTYKDPRAAIEHLVITKSCKAAIKANQWLSLPEMQALCDQLLELENPFHCPHGRPILIEMTRYDLEKMFKRVM